MAAWFRNVPTALALAAWMGEVDAERRQRGLPSLALLAARTLSARLTDIAEDGSVRPLSTKSKEAIQQAHELLVFVAHQSAT